ncbi:MAG: Stp1/IreP family PP2C-type Ser/Thr phosphatase [Candidatus Fervidibacterota bacterium]
MLCPQCGYENREGAKFCAQCGKELAEEAKKEAMEESTALAPEAEEAPVAEPLPSVAPEPLPEGALVGQRHYEIVAFIGTKDGVNEYEAEETSPRKRCPVCRTLNASESNFCEQCGNALTEAPLETLRVWLREARSVEFLQPLWTAAEKGIHHPAIAAPLGAFADSPYDDRVYLALPKIQGMPLTKVTPEDVATALAWAHLLAEALARLEEHGFGLREPFSSAVVFTEEGAPFLLPDAIGVEPVELSSLRENLRETLTRWLRAAQGEGWVERATAAIEQAPNWHTAAAALRQLIDALQAPPTLKVSIAAATDVGRRREHNEDSYLTMQVERCHLDKTEILAILAVADGMGGHAAGEVASKLCLQVFTAHLLNAVQDWLNFSEPDWHKALTAAITEANRQVFAEAQAMRNNMGTTLTVAVIAGNKVVFANVGDSRGYLLQEGKLRQITKDHSLVQQMVDMGVLTPEEARWHPQRNIITQAVGIEPTVKVDTFEASLRSGDIVLVCSDGLVDMVDDSEIERVLLSEPDLTTAAQTLLRLANEAGSDDNITVALARVQ